MEEHTRRESEARKHGGKRAGAKQGYKVLRGDQAKVGKSEWRQYEGFYGSTHT